MKKNNKTPKLRFSGYTDDWEQRKLGDYIVEYTEKTTENNQYPVLTSSRKGIFFQTDYYDGNQIASADNTGYNVVPFGYFTYRHMSDDEIFHFNINDIAKNGIVSTLYPVFTTNENLDSRYLQYQLNYGREFAKYAILQKQGGSRTYMYLNKLRNLYLTIPTTIEEQKKISEYLINLDNLITLHQRKLEKLQNMKKSCLQKMFPKDGATVPEIRFSEFQGDWEERTLGSCFDERLESLPDGELLSVTIGSGIKKFSELDRHDNSNTDKSKYKRVCIGDIAYNSMRMWQGASGRSPYEGIVSPAYTVVKPIGDIDTQFFAYMFKKKEIIHLFEINSQGLTSDTWNLKYPAFSKIVVRVPRNVEEQSRIARFLLELDELISCTEQEIEITKRMKKGCLQKMFV